jgi:hypothetical protein
MMRRYQCTEDVEFFSIPLAKSVIGILGILVRLVGEESLLGLILRQTRSEIASLVRDEERTADYPNDQWFKYN